MKKAKVKTPEEWPIVIKRGSATAKIFRTPENGRDRFTVEWYEGPVRSDSLALTWRKHARGEERSGHAERGQGSRAGIVRRGQRRLPVRLGEAQDSENRPCSRNRGIYRGQKQGVPLAVAAKFYAESHNAKLPDRTVSEVVEEMIEAKRKDGAGRAYLAPLKRGLGHFKSDFKDNIAMVQTADIDAWLRKLKLSARSRNNHPQRGCAPVQFRQGRWIP